MLPIAVLPAAALLLRVGQPDMLGVDGLAQYGWLSWLEPVGDVMAAAGDALFAALPLLFALGVAIGFARKSDGSTALAGLVGYLVFRGVTEAMSPHILGEPAAGEEQELINFGVLGGIIMGIVAAVLWQRFYRIKLPSYLAFFGGRRFVPIVTSFAAVLIGVLMSFIYRPFSSGLASFGEWTGEHEVAGGGLYGFANRMLIPLGLHHIPNNIVWFQVGDYETAAGEIVHGDIPRFFANDPTAGSFMTGFFPIMMFALPAAALAIWHTARPSQKKIVGGIMLSAALTSFITGVTEPLEFAFLFVAFPLFVVHAILTGTSLALVNALELRDGFGFSAGGIDYLLNFRIAEGPLWLIVIGLGYAVIYYVLFRWIITKWNMRTPGREEDTESIEASLGEEAAEIVAGQPGTAPSTATGTAAATTATGHQAVRQSSASDDDLPPLIDQPSDTDPR
ncbi:PTS transporter subunit EIIC [Phytoactinopolyspora limicola]|uniref:PTS transporter subunit EIIC n=1 Tax=Phytoactinopolyspora limicola TaxID=2715536 RepID=UPI0031B5DE76